MSKQATFSLAVIAVLASAALACSSDPESSEAPAAAPTAISDRGVQEHGKVWPRSIDSAYMGTWGDNRNSGSTLVTSFEQRKLAGQSQYLSWTQPDSPPVSALLTNGSTEAPNGLIIAASPRGGGTSTVVALDLNGKVEGSLADLRLSGLHGRIGPIALSGSLAASLAGSSAALKNVALNLNIQHPNLAKLLAGLSLKTPVSPALGGIDLIGKVSGNGQSLQLSDLKGQIGPIALAGSLNHTIVANTKRVTSQRLRNLLNMGLLLKVSPFDGLIRMSLCLFNPQNLVLTVQHFNLRQIKKQQHVERFLRSRASSSIPCPCRANRAGCRLSPTRRGGQLSTMTGGSPLRNLKTWRKPLSRIRRCRRA